MNRLLILVPLSLSLSSNLSLVLSHKLSVSLFRSFTLLQLLYVYTMLGILRAPVCLNFDSCGVHRMDGRLCVCITCIRDTENNTHQNSKPWRQCFMKVMCMDSSNRGDCLTSETQIRESPCLHLALFTISSHSRCLPSQRLHHLSHTILHHNINCEWHLSPWSHFSFQVYLPILRIVLLPWCLYSLLSWLHMSFILPWYKSFAS